MMTGGGGGWTQLGILLGFSGSSIATWNTGWTDQKCAGSQSMNELRPTCDSTSKGPSIFSPSFFDGWVVQKYSVQTNTHCPGRISGAGSCFRSAYFCIHSWAAAIWTRSSWCNLSKSTVKSLARAEEKVLETETERFGWNPLFAKNGVIPVVALRALLYANSTSGSSSDQLSCW